jgi:predicted AlkP superfamily phosphohydrolase/phosphomutase
MFLIRPGCSTPGWQDDRMAKALAKIFVIGIDAANPSLLRRWAEEGSLPNLRSLIGRGLIGATRSIGGFFVGSTWPSFYTGVTPARHGFHYQVQLRPGTYDVYSPASEGVVMREPFWRVLSRAGRRVAILDVPLGPLDRGINGIQVVEWGGHDSLYGFQATPAELVQAIRSRFGNYPLGPSCDAIRRSVGDYRLFIDTLIRGVRVKTDLTRYFLRSGGWDFFMQVFTESHCVGHQCWHLHDVTHPEHDRALIAATGDPLLSVYAAIDAAIGELLKEVGDALVVVLAAHGMSYWYGAQFMLRDILFRLGVTQPPVCTPSPNGFYAMAVAGARQVWQSLPGRLRNRLAPLRERLRRQVDGPGPMVGADPRSSCCFPVNNGFAFGGIRLNLIGREPNGILPPGAEARAFINQLTEDLLAIVDQRTGKALVRRVLATAELYNGECLDHLPDLLVEWSGEIPTGSTVVGKGSAASIRATSPKIGVVEGVNHYGRTGEHRPEGLFIAAGPTLQHSVLPREISILDFAPTFGKLLGVDLPNSDGQPVNELLVQSGFRPMTDGDT